MANKKYTISVPLPICPPDDAYYDQYAAMVQKVNADKVYLFAPPLQASYVPELALYREWSRMLAEKISFFESMGVEAYFWMGHTIGHGGSLSIGNRPEFQQIVGVSGLEAPGCYCPRDPDFTRYICDALAIMAGSGVKLILLDDDLRINLHDPEVSAGCFCPYHMEAFKAKTGLDMTREELVQQVFTGKPNDIRRKWMALHADTLLDFAGEVEKAVHKINPDTRLGFATAMTLWSSEGVPMYDLLKRFAGETKPYLRTIGAPYWAKEAYNISWVIEYTMLQMHWAADWDVELCAEGDTFPHTRYHCPAAYLDAYQQGLLAAGASNLLSYGVAYSPHPAHEEGYVTMLAKRRQNYDAICAFFPKDYTANGITPVFQPNNTNNIVLPETLDEDILPWPDEPAAIRFLSRMGIPIAYDDNGCVFLSGYGAVGLPDTQLDALLSRGAVVDITAAKWLMERGVDLGLISMTDECAPAFELYTDSEFCGAYTGDNIWLLSPGDDIYKRCVCAKESRVLSEFLGNNGAPSFPAAVLYENAKGQRFCVLCFDVFRAKGGKQLLYNYARQEQLTRCIDWINRAPLAVTVNAQPDSHVICRRSPSGNRVAIAVQNCHMDICVNPVLRLSPDIKIPENIELLLPGANEAIISRDFSYNNDGTHGYLTIHCEIPPMGMLSVGLLQ